MKKLMFLILFTVALVSFSIVDDNKFHAEVNRVQGLYIYTDSKPISDYEYLGSIELNGVVWDNYYKTHRKALIKKAKKKYPNLNAIIITDDKAIKADIILIK